MPTIVAAFLDPGYAIVCFTSLGPRPRKIAVHGLRDFLSISTARRDCPVKGQMVIADIPACLPLRSRLKTTPTKGDHSRSLVSATRWPFNMGNLHRYHQLLPFLKQIEVTYYARERGMAVVPRRHARACLLCFDWLRNGLATACFPNKIVIARILYFLLNGYDFVQINLLY